MISHRNLTVRSIVMILRSLKEQVRVLESLTVKIVTASSTLASRVESASEIFKNDEATADQNEINEKKEISVKSDGVSGASKGDSSDKREVAESSSEKRAYRQSNEEPRSRKEEDVENENVNLEDSISSFFTNVMNNISGQDRVKSDINNMANPEKKKKQRIKLGSAQQKRVDLARQSGQAIRDMSGALAKTATDTLGFWVGLGYDELEVVEDEGRDNKRLGEGDGVSSDFNQRSIRFEDYRSSSKIDDIRLGEEDIKAADYSARVSDETPDGSWNLPFSAGDDVYLKPPDSPAVDDDAKVPREMPSRGLDGLQMGVEETEDFRFVTSEDDQINNDKLAN